MRSSLPAPLLPSPSPLVQLRPSLRMRCPPQPCDFRPDADSAPGKLPSSSSRSSSSPSLLSLCLHHRPHPPDRCHWPCLLTGRGAGMDTAESVPGASPPDEPALVCAPLAPPLRLIWRQVAGGGGGWGEKRVSVRFLVLGNVSATHTHTSFLGSLVQRKVTVMVTGTAGPSSSSSSPRGALRRLPAGPGVVMDAEKCVSGLPEAAAHRRDPPQTARCSNRNTHGGTQGASERYTHSGWKDVWSPVKLKVSAGLVVRVRVWRAHKLTVTPSEVSGMRTVSAAKSSQS